MPNIDTIIDASNFEIIRDAVGAILIDEINGQIALLSALGSPTLDQRRDLKILQSTTVWSERMVPLQQDESYIIVVMLYSGDMNNQSVFKSDTDLQVYIDVYGKAKADKSTGKRADRNSAERTSRLVAYLYKILQHPYYRTLGFSNNPQLVRSRNFTSFRRTEVEENETSVGVIMYRSIMSVDSLEENGENIRPLEISNLFTNVHINDTDRGFQFLVTK